MSFDEASIMDLTPHLHCEGEQSRLDHIKMVSEMQACLESILISCYLSRGQYYRRGCLLVVIELALMQIHEVSRSTRMLGMDEEIAYPRGAVNKGELA